MTDSFDKHIETQYANKPYFIQLKRVWRMAKKMANVDKPKKIGFYLQMARKLEGSAQINEKIVKDIFGKSQEMSPNKFIAGVFEHAVPEGEKLYIKPETAYQTTQRLMPDRDSGGDDKKEGLNKTIQVSVFGDIYDKILNKYKNKPNADDLFRAVNRYLSSHFANAAGFVRWTHVAPNWIHFDAFQTDFFSNLKSMAYQEKENKDIQDIVTEFRKYEDEFFKTAVSYVVRTNPNVKIFTASTPEIVQAVEHIRGDVKLKKYYHQIPKKLGFKLVPIEKLNQILRTRPGQPHRDKRKTYNKAEKLINKFSDALSNAGGSERRTEIITDADIKNLNKRLAKAIVKDTSPKITPERVDTLINANMYEERYRPAYHQHITKISQIVNNNIQARTPDKSEQDIINYLNSKQEEISNDINKKQSKIGGKIWWSNRGTIFESAENRSTVLIESIKELSRY